LTGQAATQAIATHFHADRTEGIEAMHAANVAVFAHPFTVGLAQAYSFPVPQAVKGLRKGRLDLGIKNSSIPAPVIRGTILLFGTRKAALCSVAVF
jgi:CRISPR-associated Cas5-like protein